MGKLPYHHPTSQARIQQLIIERARQGQTVVRLKVVERGFSDSPRITRGRLADLPGLVGRIGVISPAVVVIGEVAAFAADQVGADPLRPRFSLLADPGR